MAKLLSCNLTDEQMDRLEAEAKRAGKTKTEMVQKIVDFYFNQGTMHQYREELLREVVKTRSFCRRMADKLYGLKDSDEFLGIAEGDMQEYMKQRKKP